MRIAVDLQNSSAEPTAIGSEADLASVAYAIAGPAAPYSAAERKVVRDAAPADPALVATVRAAIEAGGEPLGDAFCRLRPAARRRANGAVYTPPVLVDSMVAWAAGAGRPMRIVDPGAGSGRFLIAAARRFPDAALVAVDTDPLALLMLRANAAVHGLAGRLAVRCGDYRRLVLSLVAGATLFIGNPPYVRHHDIGAAWKDWFAETAASFGLKASKLAGLHVHFYLKTRQLARDGDYGTFVTSAEWLDVNYGSVLRRMLADGLGGTALHVLAPESLPFAATATTGAIACFRAGSRPDRMIVRSVGALDRLDDLAAGRAVPWATLAAAPRWSVIVRPGRAPPPGHVELGELFRVHRGQVTGRNDVWIAGAYPEALPASVLFPAVTRARELFAAGDALDDAGALRRVIDLPVALDALDAADREPVERFLAWARRQGVPAGYIASARRAWWSVGLRPAAPILCTYMARRPPAFVRNACRARHINIAHGLYPRAPLPEAALKSLVAFLRENVSVRSGRTYAGGLTKFEPREIERLPVPEPRAL